MTELRLHRELYAGPCVDEAVKLYERYGTFELIEEPGHWIVRVSGSSEARERLLTRELANYALGLSIRGQKVAA